MLENLAPLFSADAICWRDIFAEVVHIASPYLVTSVCLTILLVFGTSWWIKLSTETNDKKTDSSSNSSSKNDSPIRTTRANTKTVSVNESSRDSDGYQQQQQQQCSVSSTSSTDSVHAMDEPVTTGKWQQISNVRQQLEQSMTEEERKRELITEAQQMSAILSLLKQNEDKFGHASIDDVRSQMKLYM